MTKTFFFHSQNISQNISLFLIDWHSDWDQNNQSRLAQNIFPCVWGSVIVIKVAAPSFKPEARLCAK